MVFYRVTTSFSAFYLAILLHGVDKFLCFFKGGISRDQVMINIQRYGNTTAATIPLCLWEWENKLKEGDKIILSAFGGGFTWGAIYLKWAYNGARKA